ncbi:MAG: GNAT family N-acetyltransferase [Nocardioidaceae bacterium]
MTITDPLAGKTGRTPLYDESGRLLLVFTVTTDTRSGRTCADGVWRPDDVPITTAVEAALDSFAGWTLSTADRALAEALVAAGSTRLRHAHLMSHDLSTVPFAPATELAIEPLGADDVARHAERLEQIAHAAYPPGHPDHYHEIATQAVDEFAAIGRGELLGPLMVQSQLARHHGVIVGACLVVDREGQAPQGGPWIIELFRDPASTGRGIGEALVVATLTAAHEAGIPSVCLAVSDENAPAVRLYSRLGFVDVEQSWTLALPA